MNTYRGMRHALRSFVPIWLSERLEFRIGYMILWSLALYVDVLLKWCVEGVYCWFPGYSLGASADQVDASTALPYVGRSRGIQRGEIETDQGYAARLITWLEDWEAAGSSEILAAQIQAYLGNTPTVRIVDRAGNWVSIDPSGNITKVSAAWDWDEVLNPERDGWWSDLWIIVTPCEWPVTGTTLASLVGSWGTYGSAELGLGHAVPRTAVDVILSLVAQWKGAHCWCQAILFSYNPALFVPGSAVTGDPDGTWGNWSKVVGGVQVPARPTDGSVRIWVPANG